MTRPDYITGYVWEPSLNRYQLRFFFRSSAPDKMNGNSVLYNEFPFPVRVEYGGVDIGEATRITVQGVDISEMTAHYFNGL